MSRIYNNPHEVASTVHIKCFWPKAFTNEEVDLIVKECEEVPTFTGGMGEGVDLSYRKSSISMHHIDDKNRWIFNRLNHIIERANEDFFQFKLIGFDFFQYGTYGPNDFYHYHCDTFFENSIIEKNTHLCRKLSVSILLNSTSEFQGGDFEICVGRIDSPHRYHLEKGDAIFFPSYHLHRVTEVITGIRKSLVVWVLGPKWV